MSKADEEIKKQFFSVNSISFSIKFKLTISSYSSVFNKLLRIQVANEHLSAFSIYDTIVYTISYKYYLRN